MVAERPDEVLMAIVSPSSPCFAGTFSRPGEGGACSKEMAGAALAIAMVRVRDYTAFDDPDAVPDRRPAAYMLIVLLQDAVREAEGVVDGMG